MVVTRRSAALIAVAAASAALAAPAQATFPGRNGSIFWTSVYAPGGTATAELVALGPHSRVKRSVWECGTGAIDRSLSCTDASGVAAAPDGSVAVIWIRNTYSAPSPPPRAVLHTRSADGATSRDVDLPASWSYAADGDMRPLRFVNDGLNLTTVPYTAEPGGAALGHTRVGMDGIPAGPIGPAGATSLDWSLDGRAVYELGGNLYVLERDGGSRRLTRRGGTQPSWSPHGRWIAFTREHHPYVINSAGGRPRRLTARRGEWPVWSPDGRKLAYLGRGPRRAEPGGYLSLLDIRTKRSRYLSGEPFSVGGDGRYMMSPPEWQALPR